MVGKFVLLWNNERKKRRIFVVVGNGNSSIMYADDGVRMHLTFKSGWCSGADG